MDDSQVYPPFSVLMSLYAGEKPAYLDECMQSLFRQTVLPAEIVIVLDGPIPGELEVALAEAVRRSPVPVRIIRQAENRGLGVALSIGLPECANELIARMDTDDISADDRFEKQLRYFAAHPECDICGGDIAEFETTPEHIVAWRRCPLTHEAIAEYQKTRTAVNHVTAMYKKSAVLRAGNYQSAPLMEDDDLWVRMLQTGSRFANIRENLVFVRVGSGMIERRGGWSYFKKYRSGRRQIRATGYISRWDYFKTVAVQFVVALMPSALRRFVFFRLLRR